MNSAILSADIISFTALSLEDKRKVESQIRMLLNDLSDKYKEQGKDLPSGIGMIQKRPVILINKIKPIGI